MKENIETKLSKIYNKLANPIKKTTDFVQFSTNKRKYCALKDVLRTRTSVETKDVLNKRGLAGNY